MIRRPPRSTLFPTRRSSDLRISPAKGSICPCPLSVNRTAFLPCRSAGSIVQFADHRRCPLLSERSEEHTSELQSPCNLVCSLLLEKKKDVLLASAGYVPDLR